LVAAGDRSAGRDCHRPTGKRWTALGPGRPVAGGSAGIGHHLPGPRKSPVASGFTSDHPALLDLAALAADHSSHRLCGSPSISGRSTQRQQR
jgi:hypothetical protein